MNKILVKYVGIVGILFVFSLLNRGLSDASDVTLVIFGLVILLSSLLIRPVLLALLLPINIITAGLFTVLANTLTIMFADMCMPGISAGGFMQCLILSLPIYAVNWLINTLWDKTART